jgi:hypothetical protein
MKIDFVLILVLALVGTLTAMLEDWRRFAQARKLDPTLAFDWSVAIPRWVTGFLSGFTAGLAANGLNLPAGG